MASSSKTSETYFRTLIKHHLLYFSGALFFLFFYFSIWPIIWHLAILPHAQSDKHRLRIESYSPNRSQNTSLFLDQPGASLKAYAIWRVPREGLYHIRLSCDDNGEILIDNQPIISLRGISPKNVGEVEKWLTPGLHFLELQLNNIYEKGWLTVDVGKPGEFKYAPLNINEISFPDIGNLETLLEVVFWGKSFSLFTCIGFCLFWVRSIVKRREVLKSAGEESLKTKVVPHSRLGYSLLWVGLFLFLLHFAIWPLAWHWVFLPHMASDKHTLKIESDFPNREVNNALYLDASDSSLSAYAVWKIRTGGLYHFRLSCEGTGTLLIDNRTTIAMKGFHSFDTEVTDTLLTPGPHLLELRFRDSLSPGWLRLEVASPNQTQLTPVNKNELTSLELGNVHSWVNFIFWGEYLCFLGSLLAFVFGLGIIYFCRWSGVVFLNQTWRDLFGGMILFALSLSLIYFTKHPIPPISGDGIGYYAFLPSYLIYHDLSFQSLYQVVSLYGFHGWDVFTRYPETGYYVGKSMGIAILILPFFLAGHLLAPLLGSSMDGFSVVYQLSVILSNIFYMSLGLLILSKILLKYFSPNVVMATIISVFLGTNFLACATTMVSLNHIYSFFLICLMVYLIPHWYNNPSPSNTLFLALISGMIFLVRNNNASILIFIPLYGIIDKTTLKERLYFFWKYKNRMLLLTGSFLLILLPQLITLSIAANKFALNSYPRPEERFYFFSPQVINVLFGPHRGLFIWSPILLFSILGFFKMDYTVKLYRLPIIVCLLLQLYIVSSWYDWALGWGFGHKAFVDTMGMFTLPLASFYGNLKEKVGQKAVAILSFILITFCFYSFLQFFQGIFPVQITWQNYIAALLKQDGFLEFWQWLSNPKLNNYMLMK
jgi:hypothetical protein